MKSKLISMCDFVLNGQQTADYIKLYDGCRNYANFLKQLLELWMFVPCDEDGNVFNLPKKEDCLNTIDFNSKLMDYADAKDNVLFEGFETKKGYADYKEDWLKIDEKYCEGKKVEDLVQFNLQLTQTAIKQLGL